MPIAKVGVVGCGLMGAGIAQTAAQSGFPVVVREVTPELVEKGLKGIEKNLDRLVEKGALSAADREATRGRLRGTTSLEPFREVDLVIEAIIEQLPAKRELYTALDKICPKTTIYASNTSSLSITEMAVVTGRPDRFVGLHFFNPVTKMKLVELIFPRQARADTRRRALALCETFEKTPVEVPDVPGFVVNRLLFPYLFSAVRLLEETGMDPADVDTCMRLGAGHPMGPLALLDLVGLDVSRAIGQTIGQPVPGRIEQLVAEGALGRKSRRGFHVY
jgi:3-hydroxybutyryl-CoA dehydrogenase